jgi:hypothetical protein
MSKALVSIICLALLFALPKPAHAYLDANTGSLILQILVGGLAGLALVGKLMWHRITSFLGIRRPDDADN